MEVWWRRRRIMGEEGRKHSCAVDASDQQSNRDRNRKAGRTLGRGRLRSERGVYMSTVSVVCNHRPGGVEEISEQTGSGVGLLFISDTTPYLYLPGAELAAWRRRLARTTQ
jgi:hypothetical protein